ncbi:Fur family transcriptional regulator [Globicatella sanguinis]
MKNHHHCRDHEHYDVREQQTVEEIVADGLTKFKEAGYKKTKKREEILTFFAEENRYISAQDVHQHMVKKYPTMSYNTTYRNLYDFVETGLLEGTEYNQEQMFRISCGADHHHHHFICTNCGVAIPLDACPMDQVTTNLSDVEIEWHRFEIFGKCQKCKNLGVEQK